MKFPIIFLPFLSLMTAHFTYAATSVEYVKVCDIYGTGWYYIPGTDNCYNTNTGMERHQTARGTVNTESLLAARVSQLEIELKHLYLQFGIQPSSIQNKTESKQ